MSEKESGSASGSGSGSGSAAGGAGGKRPSAFGAKFKTWGKTALDKTWAGLDVVGKQVNKGAAKVGAEAFWPTDLAKECEKAARILRTFTASGAAELPADTKPEDRKKTQKVLKKISPEVLQGAKGLAIFTVFRTGFGWSGAGGSGVVVARLPDGSWSAPSGILLHTLGFGFLIGLDVYDVVLVLRNEKAVKTFTHPKVSLGGEVSVAAGPVGSGAMLESGVEASPCWSYVKSKGFYAGIQLDGNIVIERTDENARFYHTEKIKATEILTGGVPVPHDAEPLIQTILSAEGRQDKVTRPDLIPEGPSPSEFDVEGVETPEGKEVVPPPPSYPATGGEEKRGFQAPTGPPPALPARNNSVVVESPVAVEGTAVYPGDAKV